MLPILIHNRNCVIRSDVLKRWVVQCMVVACLLVAICAPPVKHTKPRNLKEELGPMYEKYRQLQANLKIMYLKELVSAPPGEREAVHERWKDIMHQHVPAHSPGSMEQLKQTWKDGGMGGDSFSMMALFRTHDYDNDGFLSEDEMRALYLSELERAYPDHTSAEDMLRAVMDAKVLGFFLELIDKNQDGRVSSSEFVSYTAPRDDGFDWMDEDDLPDLEHAKDDPLLVEAVRKDLSEHPNDTASEELMHKLSGMAALGEKKPVDAYTGHQAPHDHATPPPAVHNSHAPSTQSTPPASKA